MIELASFDKCTACGACAYVCPKSCIKMTKNTYGTIYPVINEDVCIECGRCMKVCPIISPLESNFHNQSYAAWNKDEEERKNAASGGIATAIYKYALENGWYIVGALMNTDFLVSLKVTNDKQYLTQFRNSKYVFSEPYFSYKEIEELLRKGHTVVIIALPCQIAAYRKIYNKFKNVYYIDLICHGVISASFLQQHVYNIELKGREKIQKIYFRDPLYNTDTFTFTLYNESGKCVYSKNVLENDFYQEAYHDGIAYRENCYHCNFASTKRISDITLGDYYGLGKETPFNFSHKKVSCLLVNTSRGKDLLGKLIESNMIKAIERPREEPINGNRMLRQPCLKSRKRKYFEYYIVKFNGDFNSAISAVIKRYSKWKKMNEFILCLKRSIKQRLK